MSVNGDAAGRDLRAGQAQGPAAHCTRSLRGARTVLGGRQPFLAATRSASGIILA